MTTRLWNPSDLGSSVCRGWYNSENKTVNGTDVESLTDLSGNNNDLGQMPTASYPSTTNASTLNGITGVRFTSGDALKTSSNLGDIDTQNYEMIVVVKGESSSGSGSGIEYVLGWTDGSNDGHAFGYYDLSSFGFTAYYQITGGSQGSQVISGDANTLENPASMLGLGKKDSSYSRIMLDGSEKKQFLYDTVTTNNPIYLGTRGNVTPVLNGTVFEVVILLNNSSSDREKTEGYLAHRYGIEGNLPSDHPYKSAAPTVTALGLGGAGNTVLDIFVDTGATRKIGTIEGSFDSSVDTFTKYLDFLESAEVDDVKLGLRTSKRFYGDLQLCEIKSIFTDTWVVTYNKTHVGGIHTSLERAVGEVAGTIANRGGWILNDIIPRDGYVDPDA